LDGPLFICTKEQQRAVICVLWAEGVPGAEMHRRISVQYGNSVVSQWKVYKWLERFRNGGTSIKHEDVSASGSFLMLDACAIILEPLDPFVDHQL
jgi:hypothetical protein